MEDALWMTKGRAIPTEIEILHIGKDGGVAMCLYGAAEPGVGCRLVPPYSTVFSAGPGWTFWELVKVTPEDKERTYVIREWPPGENTWGWATQEEARAACTAYMLYRDALNRLGTAK